MRITTKGRYGIRAVVMLASASDGKPIAISKIAQDEEVSAEFLEQIFFRLKKSGLIKSLRGPRGGFLLGRNPEDISLHDILAAVDEAVAPAPCADPERDYACARDELCPTRPMWQELSAIVNGYLSRVSVKDLLDRKKSFHPELLSSLEQSRSAARV